jgi:hypothetical protein
MLTILEHKGNANQKYTKIPPHSGTAPTTNVGENAGVGGGKEPSYTAGGNAS